MASSGLEFRIRPRRGTDKRVQREMRRMAGRIKDRRAVNKKISVWLSRWVGLNFKTEGGKVGGWTPFKYGGRVMPGGFIDTSAKLLQDTGEMRVSLIPFSDAEVAGIGSVLNRSLWHDQGTKTLPRRSLLPDEDNREVNDAILKIYDLHVRRAIR